MVDVAADAALQLSAVDVAAVAVVDVVAAADCLPACSTVPLAVSWAAVRLTAAACFNNLLVALLLFQLLAAADVVLRHQHAAADVVVD